MLDKINFFINSVLVTTCAYAAIVAYGQYQGYLDIRFYSTQEQAYQAKIRKAEAMLAREAIPHEDVADESRYAEASVWSAVDHPRHHSGR